MQDLAAKALTTTFTQTIAGEAAPAKAFMEVISPSTGKPFQTCPVADLADIDRAVAAARRAQPAWAALSWEARRAYLERLADAIEAEAAWLATLGTMEIGKTIANTLTEVRTTAARLRITGGLEVPNRVVAEDATRLVIERWRPLGVVAAIAPWNGPVLLGMTKVVTALIGGNTVVLKPSELTPLATLEIGRIARDILPPGVFNVIAGGGEVGAAMAGHDGFDKVSFTGSTATGVAIAKASANFLRSVTLELGGNDAAILLEDGDVPDLVSAAVRSGLANCGQFCAGVKRIYAPRARYEEVCESLTAAAKAIRIGDPMDPGIDMGPIQNRRQFEKVCAYVDDARLAGGRVLTGGTPLPGEGYFYPPTVVAGLADGARLVDEEQFGPVIPVIAYDDVEAVLGAVNRGPYGLTGSVWSADLDRASDIAGRLEVGSAWVNQHAAFDPLIAFPMIKQSGMGVDYGDHGIKGAMRLQVMHVKKPKS